MFIFLRDHFAASERSWFRLPSCGFGVRGWDTVQALLDCKADPKAQAANGAAAAHPEIGLGQTCNSFVSPALDRHEC